ncbi:protein of unknown function [Methylorubrum extorquens]|uniref:DisA/LigA helix-hairpin-helix motif domain-containing protein n=1 Tax=Methylorubrum extorquens TaxID=408 RepID=A0A2N9AIT1_METEX|nr:protein of unknown function [Methylorubrum extorquens]
MLFEAGLVKQPADLFRLEFEPLKAAIVARREALSAQRRTEGEPAPKKPTKKKGEEEDKAIKNLLASLDARRKIPLNRFLFALGIPQIGESTAKALAKRFPDMPALMAALAAATREQAGQDWLELSALPRIGPGTRDRLFETLDPLPGEAMQDLSLGARLRGRLTPSQREAVLAHYGSEAEADAALERAASQRPGDAYRLFADDGEIGPVATDSLIQFFSEPHNDAAVRALLEEVGTEPLAAPTASAAAFAGKTVVFTGSPREDDPQRGQGHRRAPGRQSLRLGLGQDRPRGRRPRRRLEAQGRREARGEGGLGGRLAGDAGGGVKFPPSLDPAPPAAQSVPRISRPGSRSVVRRGGKSGLHGEAVPDNLRRGRPQGQCHREQTALQGSSFARSG